MTCPYLFDISRVFSDNMVHSQPVNCVALVCVQTLEKQSFVSLGFHCFLQLFHFCSLRFYACLLGFVCSSLLAPGPGLETDY